MSDLRVVDITPDRMPEVDHLHDCQARMLGIEPERIDLFRPPVLTTVGFEDARGRLRGAYYLEHIAELSFIGNSRAVSECALTFAEAHKSLLRRAQFQRIRTFMPHQIEPEVGPYLRRAGFVCANDLGHYAIRIGGGNVKK